MSIGNLLRDDAHLAYSYIKKDSILIGCLAAFLMFPGYLLEMSVMHPTYDTFGIRISGVIVTALCTLFIYLDKNSRYSAYVFVLGTSYLFCVVFSSLMLVNVATTSLGDTVHFGWIIQYLCALFLLVLVLGSLRLTLLVWLLGAAASFVFLLPISDPNWGHIYEYCAAGSSIWITAIFIGALANRNFDYIQLQKVEAAKAIGSNVAHELRTPLSGIYSRSQGALKLLPDIHSFGVTDSNNSDLDHHREIVADSLKLITYEAAYANKVIDLVLEQCRIVGDIEMDSSPIDLVEFLGQYPSLKVSLEENAMDEPVLRILSPKLLLNHAVCLCIEHLRVDAQSQTPTAFVSLTTSGSVELLVAGNPCANTTDRHRDLMFCRMFMEKLGGKFVLNSYTDQMTAQFLFPAGSTVESY